MKAKTKKSKSKNWMRAIKGGVSVKYLSIGFLGCGLLAVAAAVTFAARDKDISFTPLPSIAYRTDAPDGGVLLRMINEERAKNARTELKTDARLTAVAEKRLKDMIASQTYAHRDQAGKYYYDLLPVSGYRTEYSCENLDIENTPKAEAYMTSWLSSGEGHRDCMLDERVTKAGIATGLFSSTDSALGKQKTYLVVAVFAADPQ